MIILTAGLYPGAKGNNEAGVKSKFVGQDSANRAYLEDPRQGQKGSSRALGWTSNTGNYFGADGSQGTGETQGFWSTSIRVKNDHSSQTGSGQTQRKLRKTRVLISVEHQHDRWTQVQSHAVHAEWSSAECFFHCRHHHHHQQQERTLPIHRDGRLALHRD